MAASTIAEKEIVRVIKVCAYGAQQSFTSTRLHLRDHVRPTPTQQIFLILTAASLLRLGSWLGGLPDEGRYTETDSADYLILARNLVSEGRFGVADQPEIFRTPGYPAFLVPFSVFNFSPATICLVQIGMDVLICYLVWCVARRHFGQEAARPALVFQAFSLVSVVYACRVLSETLFTLLLLLFLLTLLATRDTSPTRQWYLGSASGAILSCTIYVRFVAMPWAIFPVLLLLWWRSWRGASGLVITCLILVAPWLLRNDRVAGFTGFSTVASVNLYR